MKAHLTLFLWLLTVAFALLCLTCWSMLHLVTQYLEHANAGAMLPGFTRLILGLQPFLLYCPLPWAAVAAVLCFRRPLSADAAFIFAGTLSVAMVVVVSSVAIGSVLPCLELACR